MSTPANITLRNVYRTYGTDHKEKTDIVHIYRDCDGYPAVGGKDIADAILAAAKRAPQKSSYGFIRDRSWTQRVLAELCIGNGCLEFRDKDHLFSSCLEYIITGDYDDYGARGYLEEDEFLSRIAIECSDKYEGVLFTGGVEAFSQWCNEQTD